MKALDGKMSNKQIELEQRRPAHAKPDFNWLFGPRNGTWKRTCGISCLCFLAPMRRLQCSTTQATFTNPSLLRATPLLRGFFSSSLADVALRLGPYMSISSLKDVCTRTQLVHIRRQIKVEQPKKTQKTTKTRRPANPPARLAFRQRKQGNSQKNKQDKQKGPEPEQNTHKSDLPRDTVVWPLHHSQKHAKNELRPRHSSTHGQLACLLRHRCAETVHEHGATTYASLSVLSDQLVQKASMERVVTIYIYREQERRSGHCARYPPQQGRGRWWRTGSFAGQWKTSILPS